MRGAQLSLVALALALALVSCQVAPSEAQLPGLVKDVFTKLTTGGIGAAQSIVPESAPVCGAPILSSDQSAVSPEMIFISTRLTREISSNKSGTRNKHSHSNNSNNNQNNNNSNNQNNNNQNNQNNNNNDNGDYRRHSSDPSAYHQQQQRDDMARSAVGDTVLNEYRFNIDNVSLDALKDQGFNPRAPVTFLIHGFTSGYPLQAWMTGIVDIYTINERKNPNKQLASQNLFVVNWHYGARSINYPRAVANVPIVSAYLVKFIDRLVAELGVNSRQIQLVGHSLGAHLAGFTGKNTKSRLGRIYGLDPAGPCFGTLFGKLGYLSFYPTSQRLAPTDAEEVITVVTNTELLGLDANLGQYSVFVEGGKTQPGCTGGAPGLIKSLETFTLEGGDAGSIACSHSRAPMLMAYRHHQGTGDNDDNDCQMVAYECDNWDNFKHGHCGYCDEQNSQCLLVGLNWQYPNKTSAQFGSSSSGAHAGGNSNYESGYNHQNNNNNYQNNNNNNYQNNNNNNYQNNNNNHNNHNNYDHGSNQQSSYGDNQQSGYGQSTSASNSNYANNNNNNNNNNNHAYGHSSSTGGHAGSQANHQGRQPNTGYNHGQSSGGSHTSHSGFNSNYGSNYGQSNNQNHGQYGQQSGHGHQSGVSPHSSASGNNYDQQGSSASNNNYGLNQANQNHNQHNHNHNQNGYSQHQGYGQDSEQYQGGTHTMTKRDLFSSIVKPVAGAILKPASVLKPLTGSGTSVPSFLGGGNNKHDRESTMDATYDQHKKQDQQPGGGNSNQKHNQSGGFGNGNANHNQNHNDYNNNNNNYGSSNNQGNSNNHGYNDNNNNNNYGNNNNNNNNYGNNNNNNNYGNNNNLLPNEKQPAINGNEPAVEGASKRPEGKMRMFLKTGETQPYCSYQYQLIMDLHSPFDTPLKPQLSLVLQDEQPRDMEAINGNSRQQEMESVRTDKNSLSTEEFGYKVNDLRYTLLLTTVNKVRKITKGTLLSLDGIDPSKIKQLRINYMSNIDYRKRQEYSSTLCVVQTTNDKPKEQTGLNPLHINNLKDRVKQNRVYFGECNSSPSQQS